MNITQEQLEAILAEFDDDRRMVPFHQPLIENPSGSDSSFMLPLRLLRASVDQNNSDPSTASRYRIWAETLRETVGFALQNLEAGVTDEKTRLSLVRVANSLGAYCAIQAALAPLGAN